MLLVAACSGGDGLRPQTATAVTVPTTLPAPGVKDQVVAASDYRLGPGDKLAINVFGVSELSRDNLIVASDGNVPLPLIGTVPAMGRTAAELSALIEGKLSERYMRNPQVTVAVTEANSQRVTLDGAVRTPGRYVLTGPTTLTEALALGQGTTDTAKASEVVIFRTIDGKRYAARFDLAAIRKGAATDPAVYGNDVVVVGTNSVRGVIKDIATVAPVLSLFFLLR